MCRPYFPEAPPVPCSERTLRYPEIQVMHEGHMDVPSPTSLPGNEVRSDPMLSVVGVWNY